MTGWMTTAQILESRGLSRNQFNYFRAKHRHELPRPEVAGTVLLWPAEILEVLDRLLEAEKKERVTR